MNNSTELNGMKEDGYTPLVDLDDTGEFDDVKVFTNAHPIKRYFHRGMLLSRVKTDRSDTKFFFFFLFMVISSTKTFISHTITKILFYHIIIGAISSITCNFPQRSIDAPFPGPSIIQAVKRILYKEWNIFH